MIARLGPEIHTKSARTRRRFLRALVHDAIVALRRQRVSGRVSQQWTRLTVQGPDPAAIRAALSRVFGIGSLWEAEELTFSSLPDLARQVEARMADRVSGQTFAVRSRRRGETTFTSRDVAVAVGAALLPHSAGVDLRNPQVEVLIETHPGVANLVVESTPGPGGLPLGTGGRALALVSGGFDSPVAAWRVMRRGIELETLTFDLGGCGQVDEALAVASRVAVDWAPGHPARAHVIDLAPVVAALVGRVDSRLRQLLLKRAMYRAGSLLAAEIGAEAIVTGESLAQVSTQTLRNLAVCEQASSVPVLRPLVGAEKEETIEMARRIGTHDASAAVQEHCAIAVGPVETWANPAEVRAAEEAVGEPLTDAWFAEAVAARRILDLREWRPDAEPIPEVDEVPTGAVLVDVREPEEGPMAGEMRVPFSRALRDEALLAQLTRDRRYVLVCRSGHRSGLLARELARRGYDVVSLAGGVDRHGALLPAAWEGASTIGRMP